jgi:membrane protease YdiL (CAAX protease family)
MHMKTALTPWNKIALVLSSFIFVYGAGSLLGLLQKNGVRLPFNNAWSFPLAMLIVVLVAFVIISMIDRASPAHSGFVTPKRRDWRLLLTFLFLLMPLALLGRLIVPSFDFWYAGTADLKTMAGLLLFSLTMPLYVLKEELIERGIMQNRLRTIGFWWMAIAISINFSLAHIVLQIPLSQILVWTASVFLGSLFFLIPFYEMTKNIWLAILLHLVFNLVIGLQIFLHVARPAHEMIFWIVMMVGSGIALVISFKDIKAFFSHAFRVFRWREASFLFICVAILVLHVLALIHQLPALWIPCLGLGLAWIFFIFKRPGGDGFDWKLATFLFLFGIVYPVLLDLSVTHWLIGVVATCWIFFL